MYKFYWNNLQGGGGNKSDNNVSSASLESSATASSTNSQSAAGQQSGKSCGGKTNYSCTGVKGATAPRGGNNCCGEMIPEVPMRNNGVTVRVKADPAADSGGKASNPSGSHRVLLKLRRMSGGSSANSTRPKSVPDASELLGNGDPGANFANLSDLRLAAEAAERSGASGTSSVRAKGSKMKNSKSMQGFYYNKTWNEKSLSKFIKDSGGQHNYENIYSSDKDSCDESLPIYENINEYRGGIHPFASLQLDNPGPGGDSIFNQPEGLVINQLTGSPRATTRSRKRQFLMGMTQNGENHADVAAPPCDGGGGSSRSGERSSSKSLYRSKSCERPKMKDAVRDTFKISSDKLANNLNRLSSNISDKMNKLSVVNHNNNNSHSNRSFQDPGISSSSSAVSPGQQPYFSMMTSSATFSGGTDLLGLSQQPHGSLLQSVAFKAVPCVEPQVRQRRKQMHFTVLFRLLHIRLALAFHSFWSESISEVHCDYFKALPFC